MKYPLRFFILALSAFGALIGMGSAGAQTQSQKRDSASFNVATYNLRLNNEGDGLNAWPHRRAAVMALIRYHEFDVFGTQEGQPEQIDELAAMTEFSHVGVGRDDGRREGEHSAIFYRNTRFKALSHGDFWLSETPDLPSKGWDARCCNRLTTWVQLRDSANGRNFYVFSSHFDHEGEVARRESAKLLLNRIGKIAGKAPVINLGDFNSTPDTGQIRLMQAALRDAYLVSQTPPYGPVGTFNDFKIDAPMKDRIDYLFFSRQFRVLKYGVLSDSYAGRFPSDHHPVLVKTQLD